MDSKKKLLIVVCSLLIGKWAFTQSETSVITLQTLLTNMQANYELLKYEGSMVQSKQAGKKAVAYDRLPQLNASYESDLGSNNSLSGTYFTMGVIPTVTGTRRTYMNISPVSGQTGLAGVDWEVTNFGGFKANENLAKSDLLVQMNTLDKTQYDLYGASSAYYLELIRQYELTAIQSNNVARLRELKTSIDALVRSGVRPGVDSMVAAAELSKSLVQLYQAQKNFAQLQAQLSNLTSLPVNQLNPDTNVERKLINDGVAYVFTSPVDTANHPDITLFSSMYDYSKAKWKSVNNSFNPSIHIQADAWARGSSLNNSDQFNNLGQGFTTGRFNYLAGLTFSYDVFNLIHRRLYSSVNRFETEASYHRLLNEKQNLNNAVQQAEIEKGFQLKRLDETNRQLQAATSAYGQQLSLYKSGLSSIIELNTALSYYIEAQEDYLDARIQLMSSVLNYSLVTNTFNGLVQTLKL